MKAVAKNIRGDGEPSGSNGNGGDSNLITSVEGLAEFNGRLIDITRHLPVCIGSVFKIDSAFYPNWGIGLTPDNGEFVKGEASKFYKKDYDERIINPETERVLMTEPKKNSEQRMREFIAIIVREVLRHKMREGGDSFTVCDVPCRDGRLSAAIAHALHRDPEMRPILDITTFQLVDASQKKTIEARRSLNQFGGNAMDILMSDENFFSGIPHGTIDVVVSLSHFHHKPFLGGLLAKVRESLARDGVLVVGDWHSLLCSHPYFMKHLFDNIWLDSGRKQLFEDLMGGRLAAQPAIETTEERMALMDHVVHWRQVYEKLKAGTISPKPRVYVLGAYDTSEQRVKKLEDAGFVLDQSRIRKAFGRSKGLPLFSGERLAVKNFSTGSDSHAVMMAIKKR